VIRSKTDISQDDTGILDGRINRFYPQAKNVFLIDFSFLKAGRDVFEFFVFNQLPYQFPAGIFALLLRFLLRPVLQWKQHSALDHHQRGGHDEKFAGDIQIEHFHHVQQFHVLRRNSLDGDVVNVHLLLADKIEKKVQWAFKYVEFNFVISLSGHVIQVPWRCVRLSGWG
jgi:hypothetical protein